MDYTTNHQLSKPTQGEEYGDAYRQDADYLEGTLPIRDTYANRSNYEPKADAVFVATDTGAVLEGDGSSWNHVGREMKWVRHMPQSSAPSNPRVGMQVLADGTNWDAGVGDGTARLVMYDGLEWVEITTLPNL